MSHSNIIAPIISHCGTCLDRKTKEFNSPCCFCRANSAYREDPKRVTNMAEHRRIKKMLPRKD